MRKTTVYLPDDVKSALSRASARRGVSEAELIRAAIAREVGGDRPRPRGALFSGSEALAENVDEHLGGFGDR